MAGAPSVPLSSESKSVVAFRVDINATCYRASMTVLDHYGQPTVVFENGWTASAYAQIIVVLVW